MRHVSVVLRAMVIALMVAVACSSPEGDGTGERLGTVSSALTTIRYEAEDMIWSGTEGVHGEIRTWPPPTHRYFWTDGYIAQSHDFVGGSTKLTVRAMVLASSSAASRPAPTSESSARRSSTIASARPSDPAGPSRR
jgi:hypothetical protein